LASFNGKLRDEPLNGEIFDTLLKAQGLVERWRKHYNQVRPHSALGHRPPPPMAIEPEHLGDLARLAQTLSQEVVAQMGAGQARQAEAGSVQ